MQGNNNAMLRHFALLICISSLLISCVTTDPFIPVDNMVQQGEFPAAVERLEERKNKLYRNRDSVLYYLDKGMLARYAGDYTESITLLQQGERAIEANYSVSISQEIGTFITSDRAREYDGEDYEDIYLNLFNALNYYHCGDLEGAMVEIRRSSNKLRDLSSRYGILMTNMQRMAIDNGTDIPRNPDAPSQFNNSALARYLGMLFYRGTGNMDSARIDQNQIRIAMANNPAIYTHPVPSSIAEELNIPRGMARLNVISFTGRSPIKEEEVTRIFLRNSWIRIALPVMVSRPSQINSVEVILDSGESFTLELLEDISAVAKAAFTHKKNVIYTKTIMRAVLKGLTTSALFAAAETSENNSGLFTILGVGAQVFSEASERADLRMSRFFPGKAYVGGINLPPGTYSFTVTYYDHNKQIIAQHHHENVEVLQNTLNLTEDVCLK